MSKDVQRPASLPAADGERLMRCMSMVMHHEEVQALVEVVERLLIEQLAAADQSEGELS